MKRPSIIKFCFSLPINHCYTLLCVRLADHFGGKLHMGFVQIREKMETLEVNLTFVTIDLLNIVGDHLKEEGTFGKGERRKEKTEKQVNFIAFAVRP